MSQPTPPNRTVVMAMTVIAVVAMACTTVLIVYGKSVGDLLAVLAVAAVPVLSYFGAQLHGTVQEVKTNTNGRISQLQDAVIQLATANTPAPQQTIGADTPAEQPTPASPAGPIGFTPTQHEG